MNSNEFTHPEINETYEKLYLISLIEYLESKSENKLARILKDSKCQIVTHNVFSRKRWNAQKAEVYFYVPVGKITEISDNDIENLKTYCDTVMPKGYGYDVMKIEVVPSSELDEPMTTKLNNLKEEIRQSLSEDILSSDLIEKGKDMANVYLYLYCVENSLRLFIEKIGTDNFGESYLDSLSLRGDTRKKIESRKKEEQKKKWLRIRGDSIRHRLRIF